MLKESRILVDKQLSDFFAETEFAVTWSEFVLYDSPAQCLSMISDGAPQVLVVYGDSESQDGLALCEKVKLQFSEEDIYIIVIADDSTYKFDFYDADVHHVSTLPIDSQELVALCNVGYRISIKNRLQKKQIKKNLDSNHHLITVSDEQVSIIGFFESISNCKSLEELAQKTIKGMRSFELNCSLQMRSEGTVFSYGDTENNEITNPLELELFDLMKHQGRIVPLGRRLLFNFDRVSLLVKNPPNDLDKLGRFRDHLAIVLRCVETKMATIESEKHQINHYNELTAILSVAAQILPDIEKKQQLFKCEVMKVNENLLETLTHDFLILGLNEEQEESLLEMVNCSLTKSSELYDKHGKDEQVLRGVLTDLNQLLAKSLTRQTTPVKEEEIQYEEELQEDGVMFL